jgi:HK97 gp10 family phage protein
LEIIKLTQTATKKTHRTKYKTTGFEIEGLEELIASFSKLGDDAIYKLSEPSVKAAQIVQQKAKSKIHNRTGELYRGIKLKKPGKQKNKKAYRIFATVGLARSAMHGVPVELGHKLVYFGKKTNEKVEEKPFLRPAADESKEEVARIITDAMNKILNDFGGG